MCYYDAVFVDDCLAVVTLVVVVGPKILVKNLQRVYDLQGWASAIKVHFSDIHPTKVTFSIGKCLSFNLMAITMSAGCSCCLSTSDLSKEECRYNNC